MNATPTERLRELVTDYYHGLLTYESYREQRGQLLDGLDTVPSDDGEDDTQTRKRPVPDFTPEVVAGIEEQLTGDTGTGDEAESDEDTATLTVPRSGRGKWIAVAAIVVIAGGIGTFMVLPRSPGPVAPAGGTGEPIPAASIAPLSAAETMIEQFLAGADWSGRRIDEFVSAWESLPAPEQGTARNSAVFRRLSDVLQQRLREEEALSGPGGSPSLFTMLALAEDLRFAFAAGMRERFESGGRPAAAASAADPEPAPAPEALPAAGAADAAAANAEPVATQVVPAPTAPAVTATPAAAATNTVTPAPAPAAAAAVAPAPAPDPAPAEPAAVRADSGVAPVEPPAEDAAAPTDAGGAADDPCRAELAATRRPYCQDMLASGTAGPALVVLRPGQFMMGSDQAPEEGPARTVSIPAGFAMSLYEVSVGEFRVFCELSSYPCNGDAAADDDPVVNVNWHDAVAYAEWLSGETGHNYALPSEAEWEYAARAGTQTPYFFGDEITPSAAHSSVNGGVDGPAGRADSLVNRNDFRLLHMSGNVREWTADPWHENYTGAPVDGSVWAGGDASRRVVRGGSFSDPADLLRSAARASLPSDQRDGVTGIRLVRQLEN